MIHEFFFNLKRSMESHARELKRGKLFLPEYLKGKVLTQRVFRKVVKRLASALNLEFGREYCNSMPAPSEYDCGERQLVDYVLCRSDQLLFFLELESLDRAQLYLFREHEAITEESNENKLWYYYGTLVNHYTYKKKVPRYFVWLLILPDRKVKSYQIWDVTAEYGFFHPSLKTMIYQNPYRFYDHLIKSAARQFIMRQHDFKCTPAASWKKKTLARFQDVCELVFITCTGDRLIMSRGKDFFDPKKEIEVELDWKERRT